jgi:hypothetical protein
LLAALRAHVLKILKREIDSLIASMHFKNLSGSGACSDALVLPQDARGSPTKTRKWQGGSCTMLCVYPC